ncbi:MAG: protein kinase [Chthoniobacteraceae bacterium]
MPPRDAAHLSESKCLLCGVTIDLHADSWCERCRAQVTTLPRAPELPATPPAEIPGYRMLRPLGGGGMGVVWLAEQIATKQAVAVKFCRSNRFAPVAGSPSLRRFEREMELSARLSHPHIARVFSGGDIEGIPYFTMEYVDGPDLAEYARLHQLDRKAIVTLVRRVAEAVQHAHQNGIIHRDLKPSNILINPQGEPKVLDFGLAKALEGTVGDSLDVSLPGQLLGTPRYMAPEQVRGEAVDTRTDVYALGVIVWELLTGDHPHDSSGSRDAFLHRIATTEPRRPRTLRPDLDAELEMLLLKTLSKSPDGRYRTAGEFADELGRWLRNETLIAGRATPFYFARKWLIRHRVAVLAAAASVLALVAATVFYIVNIRRSEAETTVQKQKAEEEVRSASRVNVGVARDRRLKGQRPRTALAHLAQALQQDPDNARAALEAASQLVRGAENSEPWQVGEPLRHEAWVESAVASAGGQWIVAASTEKSAQVWDAITGQPIGAPLRHEAFVSRASLSPNGHWIVTVDTESAARVWDAATGQPVGDPLAHEGKVRSAAFSGDGRWVATASDDKTARVWDAATGKPIGVPLHHEDSVTSATFSRDGRLLVTASNDRTAQVWDPMTSKPIGAPLSHEDVVTSAVFSGDRRKVVTASNDHTAQVWDAMTGERIGTPLRHADVVTSAIFSPDGKWVLTASDDKTAQVWDAATGQRVGEPLLHDDIVWSAAFSGDGRWIVTASRDRTARIWDAATGKPIGIPLRHDGYVSSAALSPDEHWLLTVSKDKTSRVWDAATGQPIGTPQRHEDVTRSAAFSPDKTTRIWNAATGNPIGVTLRHEAPVQRAVFSPDGRWVLSYPYMGNSARVWDATGERPGLTLQHEDRVTSAAFSRDGRWIVTSSNDLTARVWNAATGQPVGASLRHEDIVSGATFSPDGRLVVTASKDNTARVWDVATSHPVGDPLRHEDAVSSAVFSPDGLRVATASNDHTARIWDATTGQPVGPPLRHADAVRTVVFSPDGSRVLTASSDKTARVWDAANGAAIGEPMRHGEIVWSATFSRDGSRIVTASWDRTAQVWDAATGRPIGEPMHHAANVWTAAFSPDGRWIVTASNDHTAQIWDAATGRPIGPPLRHAEIVSSAAFSADGRWIVTASHDKTAQIWEAGVATAGAPHWLPTFLTTLAGCEITADGAERFLPANERRRARDELLAMPDDGSDWQHLMRWSFSEPRARTISPNSPIKVSEHIEREINWALSHVRLENGTENPDARRVIEQAYEVDPSHPLIHFALAAFEKDKTAADFLRSYGLKHLPANAALCRKAASILLAQNAPLEAAEAARKAPVDGRLQTPAPATK